MGDLSRHPQVRRSPRRLLAERGRSWHRIGAIISRAGSGDRRRITLARETARSRAAAARDRLAAAHLRRRSAVGHRPRYLQQWPYADSLRDDQAQFRAARGAPSAAHRARESHAGGAGRGEDESSESAARLYRDRHRAAGWKSRVLRNRRGVGVSDRHRQGAAGRVQAGKRRRHCSAGRIQKVASARFAAAIERELRARRRHIPQEACRRRDDRVAPRRAAANRRARFAAEPGGVCGNGPEDRSGPRAARRAESVSRPIIRRPRNSSRRPRPSSMRWAAS